MKDSESKNKEYKCDVCGKVFQGLWSDEEANEEFEKNFGKPVTEDDAVLCDDCYNKIIKPQFN
jgi:hypothetical protein